MSETSGKTPASDNREGWLAVIEAVKTPLGFFVLVILLVEVILITVVSFSSVDKEIKTLLVQGVLGLLFVMVIMVPVMSYFPDWLQGKRQTPEVALAGNGKSNSEVEQLIKREAQSVLFVAEKKKPKLDLWFDQMQPVLHQVAHYSVPTYYLDQKLNVMDWNLAFEMAYGDVLHVIRGKHVVEFIARLANHDEVFAHAREFSQNVTDKKAFPYVDLEPIDYVSPAFGLIRSLKVATQLSDLDGTARGWAVALWPRQIDWAAFQPMLHERINADKMWSVYSASYDRVLLRFPPYKALIDEVISVIPRGNLSVVDLGAGTGNVTQALLEKGHRVTAIENNLGMLDQLVEKSFDVSRTKVIKCAMEHLECIPSNSFDAAAMVNVLYALADPLKCLRDAHRMLRKGAVFGLSTTHRETDLDTLLNCIETQLREDGKLAELAEDWNAVLKVNRRLEKTVVHQHSREDVKDMVQTAGFEIIKENPSTYCDAVMSLHVRKRA